MELFFATCYGGCATSDYLFKIGDFAATPGGGLVSGDPKFRVEGVAPIPTILFLRV